MVGHTPFKQKLHYLQCAVSSLLSPPRDVLDYPPCIGRPFQIGKPSSSFFSSSVCILVLDDGVKCLAGGGWTIFSMPYSHVFILYRVYINYSMLTMNNTIDCFCIIFHITKYYGIFNVLFYFNFLVLIIILLHTI